MTAWHAHETELQRWLTRHLNDPVAAQDLLQDVFIKALRQGPRFCDVANARAWLFEVSRNTLTDHLRRHHDLVALPDDLTTRRLRWTAWPPACRASWRS